MVNKKTIYLCASILLWSMFGFMAGVQMERIYIVKLLAQNKYAPFFPLFGINFYFNPLWQLLLIIAGAISGYFIGRIWWRLVYVERRHWLIKNTGNDLK